MVRSEVQIQANEIYIYHRICSPLKSRCTKIQGMVSLR